ncbi:MAG TPA: DUF4157 domain-containing protein [Bacteroidales bacterium]|nr:DUF4157 domain-containing protein [Bacteroidales bacterium]HPS17447.1 DUF4157 domain-containing protein [Bacteroidales bacterium]
MSKTNIQVAKPVPVNQNKSNPSTVISCSSKSTDLTTDLIQLKPDENFNWMNENSSIQNRITSEISQPSKQNIIQPKLEVSQPDDDFEKEADSTADMIMRKSCCGSSEEDEKIQPKLNSDFITRQSQVKEKNITSINSSLENQIIHSNSSGNPLPENTRTFMESKFGADFSNVKIHTDSNAVQLSNMLNAQAFTHGNNIYFNSGKFNPGNTSGNHLLAHELTHVLQQSNGLKKISRAYYNVGNSRVNIDYGNVVYHDNTLEYQSQIEENYADWTGQPATAIQTEVSTLSNPQKRWLLFAIDVITDNPISSLNKVEAVERLINHAPEALYAPLDNYDWHNPVFDFENEVLRVSGWFELALTAGLTPPSAQDQSLLDIAYNHELTTSNNSGSTCPATRSATEQLDEAALRSDLPPLMRTYLQNNVNRLTGRGVQSHNVSDILPIADIVQREALQFFSPYIGNGSAKDFLQTWQYSSHLTSSTATNAIPADTGFYFLLNRSKGEADSSGLFQRVKYDSRCEADRLVLEDIITQLLTESTVQTQLNSILSWQSFTSQDNDGAEMVINLQYFSDQDACERRWILVNTLCHELIHAYVHPNFSGLANGRRIVIEGFTEVLGDQLYTRIRTKALSDPSFRALFETGISASAPIPEAQTGYGDDGIYADRIRVIVGEDNFRAAYFLGQTTLAGLQPKLFIGNIDNEFEREADYVADRITMNIEQNIQSSNITKIQRQPMPENPKATVVEATDADIKEFVNSAIDYLNEAADYYKLAKFDQNRLDSAMKQISPMANIYPEMIKTRLNDDADVLKKFKDAFNLAIRNLFIKATADIPNTTIIQLYMANLQFLPEWARPDVASFNLKDDKQRKDFITNLTKAFNVSTLFQNYPITDNASLESLLKYLLSLVSDSQNLIADKLNNDATLVASLKSAYRSTIEQILFKAATALNKNTTDLFLQYRYGSKTLLHEWADKEVANITVAVPIGTSPDPISGNITFSYNGFDITIEPDGSQSDEGAETKLSLNFTNKIGKNWDEKNIITSFTPPITPTITIKTNYGPLSTAASISGYGRGTTAEDKRLGNTSLGYHEKSHSRNYLKYIVNNPAPVFAGKTGDTKKVFTDAEAKYVKALKAYVPDNERISELDTDCVGSPNIVQYHTNKGTKTKVKCP